jgi:anti-anti-sigma factor
MDVDPMRNSMLWPSSHSRKIELETEVSECRTFHVISVRGRLTIDTTPVLLAELRKVMRRATGVKVDLRQVAYLDSSGISVLIQGLKLAQEQSVDYALLDPSPKVQAVIELSQLQDFFKIETSTGDACSDATAPGETAPGEMAGATAPGATAPGTE